MRPDAPYPRQFRAVLLGALLALAPAVALSHPGVLSDPATIVRVREKVAALFPADEIVASGNDLSVSTGDLRLAVVRSYLNRGVFLEGGLRDVNATPGDLELRALLYLVNTRTLCARATPSVVVRANATFAEHARAHDTKAASAFFAALGVAKADWDRLDHAQLLADLVLKRETESTVTEEEVRRHYDEKPTRFAVPESLRARQLFFPLYDAGTGRPFYGAAKLDRDERIAAALRRARAGEDFTALARDYFPGATANRNREYVYQRGQMPVGFDEVAFALHAGQVAAVETSDGTYLLRAMQKSPARTLALAEVKSEIVESLGVLRRATHLQQLHRDANLRIHDRRLVAAYAAFRRGAAPDAQAAPD